MTQHITKTPDICGGKACIAGHRVRVMDIVTWHEQRGYAPDEIVDLFPGISLADVYAALSYYFDNMEEIKADFRESDQWENQMKVQMPSKVRAKLGEKPSA